MSVQSSKYSIFKIISADGKNEVDFAQGQFRIANFYYYENFRKFLYIIFQGFLYIIHY